MVGLTVAFTGWMVAIFHYGPSVFTDYGKNNFRHACCGTTVMSLGLLQPLNAFIRPRNVTAELGEEKSKSRFVWEIIHKCTGWLAVLLAIPTISLGLSLLNPSHRPKLITAYAGCIIPLLLILISFMFFDKHKYKREEATTKKYRRSDRRGNVENYSQSNRD
jgi:hypothetical protein